MTHVRPKTARSFLTAWFAKAARRARISNNELRGAIAQVLLGQADDLGGGVFKKRLGRNLLSDGDFTEIPLAD